MIAFLLLTAGLALLAVGGDALVRGATALARFAGVTPAVIGLTVVAMGTSAPELAVSLLAAARGQPDIAVGNVIGSNIFNIAGILAVTAMATPLPVRGSVVRLEWPVMFVVTVFALLLMRDGEFGRVEGLGFTVALIVFVAYTIRLARAEVRGAEARAFEHQAETRSIPPRWREIGVAVAFVLVGVAMLAGGGQLLVAGAVRIARLLGMTERVIGLTIVSVGTSMPELAASIAAARRGETDVAVANVIGSNIFNLLGILALTAVYTPIPINHELVASDGWWMLATSLLVFPLLRSGLRLTRLEGSLLFAAYLVYVLLLLR
jgi:cation:H+ antiporter